MDVTEESIPRSALRDILLPRLLGKVFHVTNLPGMAGVLGLGQILPNSHSRFPVSFPGHAASYFGGIGCVCVCDLRALDEHAIQTGLDAYFFLRPRHSERDVVFMILDEPDRLELILNSDIDPTEAGPFLLAPHVEAGHRGPIPISSIAEAWVVHVLDEMPDGLSNGDAI